jgi:hypothetical protein
VMPSPLPSLSYDYWTFPQDTYQFLWAVPAAVAIDERQADDAPVQRAKDCRRTRPPRFSRGQYKGPPLPRIMSCVHIMRIILAAIMGLLGQAPNRAADADRSHNGYCASRSCAIVDSGAF